MATKDKNIEKHTGKWIIKLVYAVFEDNYLTWTGAKYDLTMYENYENICKTDTTRNGKLQKRVNITGEVKQYIRAFFNGMVAEFKLIEYASTDHDIALIIQKAGDVAPIPFTHFMRNLHAKHSADFGPALQQATDSTNWIFTQFSAQMLRAGGALACLYQIFNDFTKSLAYLIGKYVQAIECTVNGKIFCQLLQCNGIAYPLLNTIVTAKREKKAPRAKVPKAAPAPAPDAIDALAATEEEALKIRNASLQNAVLNI
jgi:hypothetical protein